MTNITKDIFIKNFTSCLAQVKTLSESLDEIKLLAPFNEDNIATLSQADKKTIDAFMLRFSKTQDILGSKIFRGILLLEMEEIGSVIDILNKMEKFHILENVDEWVEIRTVRNNVIHDYLVADDEIATSLNKLINFAKDLVKVTKTLREYVKKFDINLNENQ